VFHLESECLLRGIIGDRLNPTSATTLRTEGLDTSALTIADTLNRTCAANRSSATLTTLGSNLPLPFFVGGGKIGIGGPASR
jgi:hypothetical protein